MFGELKRASVIADLNKKNLTGSKKTVGRVTRNEVFFRLDLIIIIIVPCWDLPAGLAGAQLGVKTPSPIHEGAFTTHNNNNNNNNNNSH